jgi:rhomboid protease GluP
MGGNMTDLPTPPPVARIPARSRGQAMDWSLVLASQGIEHVMDHAEDRGWGLIVGPEQEAAALAAIRQYRIENRHWPWRQTLPRSREVFDWGVLAWVLLTMVFFWLSRRHPSLEDAGVMNAAALANGQWWRLFTATLLHADVAHLASNAVFGLILIGLAMGRHGTGVGLLAALLAGAGGNLISAWVHGKPFQGLGASSVVMGALGLVAVQSATLLRQHPRALKLLLGGLAGGIMLFVLLGLSPGTDVVAHGGGFVAGIGLGLMLTRAEAQMRRPVVNLAAAVLFAGLILGTWTLAVQHAK